MSLISFQEPTSSTESNVWKLYQEIQYQSFYKKKKEVIYGNNLFGLRKLSKDQNFFSKFITNLE